MQKEIEAGTLVVVRAQQSSEVASTDREVAVSNVADGDAHATLWLRASEQAFVPASGASTGGDHPGERQLEMGVFSP